MSMEAAERIVKALLFEGHVLYPYRASSLKNQQRWPFGTLYPKAFCLAQDAADPHATRTEFLIAGTDPAVSVSVRYLQLVARGVDFHEAVERRADLGPLELRGLVERAQSLTVLVPASRTAEGSVVKTQAVLHATLEVSAEHVQDALYRVAVSVQNDSDANGTMPRSEAQLHSLLSVHALLGCTGGAFVSLLEPPESLADHADACRNGGMWPVLVGSEDHARTMLASPVILYDRPNIAPESPGDLFDATEIDEILTLRVLTLTEAERAEVVATDERVRHLLERTEALDEDARLALHGTFRAAGPVKGHGASDRCRFRLGDPVVLRPRPGGDVFDIALIGEAATIASIEEDFEGRIHYAVTVDADPGRDLGELGQPGHRFFFSETELELRR